MLKRVDRDRYTLGDAHAVARAFLENGGGRRSLDNSENGARRSVSRSARQLGEKAGQK